jgi:hypothetical protein
MLLLTSTSDVVQVITGSAGAISVRADYVDNNSGTITPGRTNTASISTATTTTVVASPSSGIQRNVKSLSVFNTSASVSNLITVVHTDGTNAENLWKGTLASGEFVIFDQNGDFTYYSAAGAPYTNTGPGRFIKTTLLTTGTSFTTSASTNTIKIRMVGGGGGGAGCTSVSSAASAGGGGGSGAYAEWTVAVSPNTAYTYAIGSAGAGASGAAGGNGTSTTFTVGSTTVTAPGGSGAPVATAVTTLTPYVGGAGGSAATNGTVNTAGNAGLPGITTLVATPLGVSGNGANSPLGSGGIEIAAVGNGNNATGYGAGGGGAFTGASTARTGGNGSAGCIIVDEYS